MRTEKQNEASRTNGLKSQGPATPEAKATSSKTAERHNLCATGHVVLLTSEDPGEFRQLIDDFIVRFQPVDGVELDLVYKLIAATWRDKRIAGMETALFELEMLRQQPEIEDDYLEISAEARHALALFGTDNTKSAAALLFRYASTARRAYAAALKALKELQGDRFNRRSHAAPQPDRRPSKDPTGNYNQQPEELGSPLATNAFHKDKLSVASRHRALASFIVLRRRIAILASDAIQNKELPNEPKLSLVASQGAGYGVACGA